VINRGALEIIDTDQPLRQGDINRLIRFPDRLVLMKLTGAQLRALTAQSGQQTRNSARLVFAGFDEKQMSVQSRPLRDEESYRVVTTEFLGNGGDGYRIFPQGKSIQRTGVDLRGLLASTIQENGVLSINILRSGAPGAWYAGWEAEGAFERNYIDNTTEQYRRQNESVSFLSGATTVAWSSSARLFVAHQRGVHEIRLDHAMDFGQIGQNFDNLKKSTDQITTDLKYRFLNRCGPFNPFISVGANTAFTENGDRPLLVRSSLGFQQQFFQRRVSVGFAGRTQRDFVVKTNDLGAEMTLDANQSFKSGARLRFQTKVFTGFTDRRVVSVENYNTLNVPLIGPIRLNIKQSNFIYRVTRIRGVAVSGVAFRTNLTVGFGYGLDWKWL
jgi:hypothetical protein